TVHQKGSLSPRNGRRSPGDDRRTSKDCKIVRLGCYVRDGGHSQVGFLGVHPDACSRLDGVCVDLLDVDARYPADGYCDFLVGPRAAAWCEVVAFDCHDGSWGHYLWGDDSDLGWVGLQRLVECIYACGSACQSEEHNGDVHKGSTLDEVNSNIEE